MVRPEISRTGLAAASATVSSATFVHIDSRRCAQDRIFLVTRRFRRWHQRAGTFGRPGNAVIPPAAGMARGSLQPRFRCSRLIVIGEEAGLRIPRRADDGLDVAAVAEHEAAAAAEHLRAAIDTLPDTEVIVLGPEHV